MQIAIWRGFLAILGLEGAPMLGLSNVVQVTCRPKVGWNDGYESSLLAFGADIRHSSLLWDDR